MPSVIGTVAYTAFTSIGGDRPNSVVSVVVGKGVVERLEEALDTGGTTTAVFNMVVAATCGSPAAATRDLEFCCC